MNRKEIKYFLEIKFLLGSFRFQANLHKLSKKDSDVFCEYGKNRGTLNLRVSKNPYNVTFFLHDVENEFTLNQYVNISYFSTSRK